MQDSSRSARHFEFPSSYQGMNDDQMAEKPPGWNATERERHFQPTQGDSGPESTVPVKQYHYRASDDVPKHRFDLSKDRASNELGHPGKHPALNMSPELFEKLYLNPKNEVKGELRQTFANPTPLALLGFLLSLSPLSCEMMGWMGSGGNGVATIGVYYFIGGFLMSLGGILEFFLGNTFSFVVFCSFGGFWFTLGATLTPAFNAYGAFAAQSSASGANAGIDSQMFHASFGFFLVFMGVMSFIYLVCSLRTNLIFVAIFFGLLMTFVVLSGAYWHFSLGNVQLANKLQKVAGAFGFVAILAGWWIFFAQMLESVDFPLVIPVGDISHLIRPMSELKAAKGRYSA